MNNNAILVLVTGVGAFVAGWFASKAYFKAENDQEIAEMREHYRKKLDELAEDAVEAAERAQKAPRMAEKPPLSSFRADGIINQYSSVVEPYRGIEEDAAKEEQEETEKLNDYGNAKVEEHKEMSKLKPKIIPSEEFGEQEDFDTTELLYFDNTDDLMTEEEEEIEDVEGLIGDALTKYGFKSSAEDELFVRNYRLRTDYHIHKIRAQ